MDGMPADMGVEAAGDLHSPGSRYTFLPIVLRLNDTLKIQVLLITAAAVVSSVIFSALLSRMLRSWVGNNISEFS